MKYLDFKIALVISLSFLLGCGEKDPNLHNIIWFENNSDKTLYICASFTDFQDTIIPADNPSLAGDYYKSSPHNKGDQLELRDTYEGRFDDLNTDLVRIFVFDETVFHNYEWDTIRNKYLVLERFDLSLEDLNNQNWTVKFNE